MLQSEFEKLAGSDSPYEYGIANWIYLDVDEDKQSFCRKWRYFKRNNSYFSKLLEITCAYAKERNEMALHKMID